MMACGEDSHGHLPNHLNTEQIRFGVSNLRNSALASHAFHILPYRGLGSGIKRATDAWPQIEFTDDRQANQFCVTLKRPEVQSGGVNALIEQIRQHPGLHNTALASLLNTSPKNVGRWVKQLRKDGSIEFVGPPKTGGYHAK